MTLVKTERVVGLDFSVTVETWVDWWGIETCVYKDHTDE